MTCNLEHRSLTFEFPTCSTSAEHGYLLNVVYHGLSEIQHSEEIRLLQNYHTTLYTLWYGYRFFYSDA